MTRTQRNWTVGILVVVSVGCAMGFAVLLGQFIHTGQRVVSAGGAPPSATGWIALCLTALGSVLGGRWAQWLARVAEFAPMVQTTISQIRGSSNGTNGTDATNGTSDTNGTSGLSDLGDLTELVAATRAWAVNKTDKTLERRWALAALGALKDVASFQSQAVANAIGLMGNAVIVECLGSGTSADPSAKPAG